jgi:hypothetical protein
MVTIQKLIEQLQIAFAISTPSRRDLHRKRGSAGAFPQGASRYPQFINTTC